MPIQLRLVCIAFAAVLIVTTAGDSSGEAPVEAIEGTWVPVELMGRDFSSFVPVNGERTITLDPAARQWSGNDGCNEVFGPLTLTPAGWFAAAAETNTDVDCSLAPGEVLPNVPVVEGASRWMVDDGELRLAAADGTILGVYRRATGE